MTWSDIRTATALKEKFANQSTVVGCFVMVSGAQTVEMCGLAGCDFVFIDTEHTPVGWEQISAMQGINDLTQLYKFSKWINTDKKIHLPILLNYLSDCEYINVEFIENKIIEVHLRVSPDPTSYQELIPVWQGDEINIPSGYTWIESNDDADNLLPQTRLGFYAK
jgi:hypothetical protein